MNNKSRFEILSDILNNLSNDSKYLSEKNEQIICSLYNIKRFSVQLDCPKYSNDYIRLDYIESDIKGNGRIIMNDFCRYADENNKILTLTPSSISNKKTYEELTIFYKSFDFKDNSIIKNHHTHQQYIRL